LTKLFVDLWLLKININVQKGTQTLTTHK